MSLNSKRLAILALVIISTFVFGSIVTAVPTNGEGSPLDELWERLLGIEEDVEEVTEEVSLIQSNLDLLERIHNLEIRLEVLENCGCEDENCFPEPDYDSDWVSMEKGVGMTLTHNLDSEVYFVYLVGKYDIENGDAITPPIEEENFHTWDYGGDWVFSELAGVEKRGIWYEAYRDTIKVIRAANDPYSDFIRVMIWILD
jgi:hypothetical protein